MVCPYQKTTVTKTIYTHEKYSEKCSEIMTTFGECVKEKCPFYYTTYRPHYELEEKCRRVEKEVE